MTGAGAMEARARGGLQPALRPLRVAGWTMTSPSSVPKGTVPGERSVAHLNLRFSMADMDAIGEMARRRMRTSDIAWALEGRGLRVTPAEVARLLLRNGHTYIRHSE